MFVKLEGADNSVRVPEECLRRSSVLCEAHAAERDATIPLPCDRAAWDDWAASTPGKAEPLAVARVRSRRRAVGALRVLHSLQPWIEPALAGGCIAPLGCHACNRAQLMRMLVLATEQPQVTLRQLYATHSTPHLRPAATHPSTCD